MRILRKLIKKILSSRGYEVYRKDFYDFNDLRVLGHLFPNNKDMTIIDAGGNTGQTVNRFKSFWPNSMVHSFEPDPDVFLELDKNTRDLTGVIANNTGLGDEVTVKSFHKMQDSGSSSFIPVNKESRTYQIMQSDCNLKHHNKTALRASEDQVIKCSITTLDEYCRKNKISKIDLLKMDVQGYEPNILRGAKEILKNNSVDAILTEIMFTDYYSERGSFNDIEKEIHSYGYVLYDIPYLARVPNENRQRIFFVDAIYIKESLLNG